MKLNLFIKLPQRLPKLLFVTGYLLIFGTTGVIANTQVVQAQGDPCQQYYGKGYCVDYVKNYVRQKFKRSIPWGGNAGQYLEQAKRYGWRVGTEPKEGAIAVWTSPGVGHVAIVESVDANTFTVSEWNWSPKMKDARCYVTENFGKNTTPPRVIQRSRSNVAGFIYP